MKVGIYARVSSEDQQERGTIENQIEYATKYCDLNKLIIEEWYKDDGVTGTLPLNERPDGYRMIQDAKDKKIDIILIYKIDRLGRAARVILNAVYELENYGVKVKSMTEPFDTGDPNGRFLLTILAGVADLDRETTLSRFWHGANRAAKAGKWLGGIVPYGYTVDDDGFLQINENHLPGMAISEVDVIKQIYALLTEHHYTTIQVADYLNALGVPPSYTKDGRKIKKGKRKENTAGIWRPARIRGIIVNTTYKGIHYYGKRSKKKRELISREVPAIISSEIWETAQNVLHDNQLESMKNSKRNYLLRGFIKCDSCGLSYIGKAYYGEGRNLKAYYVCDGKNKYTGPKLGKCDSKNIPAEYIEKLVWDDIVNFISNPGQALNNLDNSEEIQQHEIKALTNEKYMLENALYEKKNETQSILDLYRKKIIKYDDVEKQVSKVNNEIASIELRLSELKNLIDSTNDYQTNFNAAEELLESLRGKINKDLCFEEKREIVKLLLKEVRIKTIHKEIGRPYAEISIIFKFVNVVIHTDMDSY